MVKLSEALKAVLCAAIDSRAAQIDGDDELCTIGFIVKLDEKTRRPRLVLYRPESQWQVGRQEIRLDKQNQPYVVTV